MVSLDFITHTYYCKRKIQKALILQEIWIPKYYLNNSNIKKKKALVSYIIYLHTKDRLFPFLEVSLKSDFVFQHDLGKFSRITAKIVIWRGFLLKRNPYGNLCPRVMLSWQGPEAWIATISTPSLFWGRPCTKPHCFKKWQP